MNVSGINSIGRNNFTDGKEAVQSAALNKESNEFLNLVERLKSKSETSVSNVSSSQINSTSRHAGDHTKGFSGAFTSELDKNARPQGAAANQSNVHGKMRTIDKTSALYEQSLELENYFVKNMLSAMRKTVTKNNLFGQKDDYAQNMYEDMLYDNYAEELTKNAKFGLADQIYLSLSV